VARFAVHCSCSRLQASANGAVATYTYVTYDEDPTGKTTTAKIDGSPVRLGSITRKLSNETAYTILEASSHADVVHNVHQHR
jgi:hypothetical protein